MGQRLWAMVNGIVAAKKIPDTDFFFEWKEMGPTGREFHAIRDIDYMFATKYREKHASPISAGRSIAMKEIPALNISSTAALEGYDTIIADPEDFFRYFKFLKEETSSTDFGDAYNSIQFSKEVEWSRAAANSTIVNQLNWVAIHLRAGDIVYGPFRYMDRFTPKVCPAPIAEKLIHDLKKSGKEILIFGQDQDLIQKMKNAGGVHESKDFCTVDFNETQQAIFDLTLMSKCGTIYGGTSGFCLFPAAIGSAKFVNINKHYDPVVAIDAIMQYFKNPSSEKFSDLQSAFAAWYAYKIYNNELSPEEKEFFLEKACQHDPANWFYKFAQASFMISQGRISAAKEILTSYKGSGERGGLWDILKYKHGDGKLSIEAHITPFLEDQFKEEDFIQYIKIIYLFHAGKIDQCKKTISLKECNTEIDENLAGIAKEASKIFEQIH